MQTQKTEPVTHSELKPAAPEPAAPEPAASATPTSEDEVSASSASAGDAQLKPTFYLDEKRNVEFHSLAAPRPADAKAVFYLFHGCNHEGSHWFFLPEETKIIRALHAKNIHVVAVTTPLYGSHNWCWPPDQMGHDVRKVGD